jgi:hypothetical protein
MSTAAGAIEASTTDVGRLKTTSYKLDDASELLRLVIQGGGRTTHYLLDVTTRVGSCFPTLGVMIDDGIATLTTQSKIGSDGVPTPTQELTAGSKFPKYLTDFEKIDNMNTLYCVFEKIEAVKEDSDYTSAKVGKGRMVHDKQQDPQKEIGTASILKTKFKLMGWKLTDEKIQHHTEEGNTNTRTQRSNTKHKSLQKGPGTNPGGEKDNTIQDSQTGNKRQGPQDELPGGSRLIETKNK